MEPSLSQIATQITRALLSASNRSTPTLSWNASLEQALHRLISRNSLSPPLVSQVIDQLFPTHHSIALGFFNWASQQPGFSHTSLTYQSILNSLSISRQFNETNKLLKQVKSQRIDLDPSIYQSLIASQIIGKKTLDAFTLFNEISSMRIDIEPSTCNSLLAALSSDGYINFAQKVFDEMCLRVVKFNTLGFGVFIWRFCKDIEIDKILDILDKVRKLNWEANGSIIAILIVHGLCQASRVSEAFSILVELRKRDCKPDFMAYRIVAEAFRLMGSILDMEKTLKLKRKLGVAPRSTDYKEFIFYLISERRILEAKELGEVIVNGDFPIEDDVLNALIGSVSSIDPNSATFFLKFMVAKKRFPTLLTISNLSRNLCKYEKNDELVEAFRCLSSIDFFSDLESYNVMVSFLCKAGKIKDAYQVLQEMKKKGLSPDVSSYNSVMGACCKADLIRPAKRLWDEMFASGCPGNLKTYNVLICKFSELGQIEDAQQLFHHMLEKNVIPDSTTYRSLLVGLCQEKNIDAAFDLFDRCVEQDLMIAQTTLSTFVGYLCQNGNFIDASKLLCSLSNKIEDAHCHVMLLRCLVDAKKMSFANEHIKWLEESSPLKLQAIYFELFGSHNSSSIESRQILPLLEAMQGERSKYLLDRL